MDVKESVYRILYRVLWDAVIEKEFHGSMPTGMRNRYSKELWKKKGIGERLTGTTSYSFIVNNYYEAWNAPSKNLNDITLFRMLKYIRANENKIEQLKETKENTTKLMTEFERKFQKEIAEEVGIIYKKGKEKKGLIQPNELEQILSDKDARTIDVSLETLLPELEKYYQKSKIIDRDIELLEKTYFEQWKSAVQYRKQKKLTTDLYHQLAPLSETIWVLYRLADDYDFRPDDDKADDERINKNICKELFFFKDIIHRDGDKFFFDVKFQPDVKNSAKYNAIGIFDIGLGTLLIETPSFTKDILKSYDPAVISFKLDDDLNIPTIVAGFYACKNSRFNNLSAAVLERFTLEGWRPNRPQDYHMRKAYQLREYIWKFLRLLQLDITSILNERAITSLVEIEDWIKKR